MIRHGRAAGFTVVELVVVLILVGILAAYAAPKFTGRGGYAELTVQQDLIQSIRFAQQLKMSRTDQNITLAIATNSIDILQGGASIGGAYPKSTGNDVTLSPITNLAFDRLGATNSAAISINGPGGPTQSIIVNVAGATGYAR